MKSKKRKFTSPLTGKSYPTYADMDLHTQLAAKEMASKERKLTKIDKK